MPKLWNDTIEAHRQAVRDAILDATAALVVRHGPASVTMSQVATESGIGRATLYKYFTDVGTILVAWHERQVATHLAQLTTLRDGPGDATERLRAVLSAYARNAHRRHGGDALHQGPHMEGAHRQLRDLVRDLLVEAGARDDIPASELAVYCLHALGAAGELASERSVDHVVTLTLAALRP